jgi:hypothetical protein
VEFLLSECPRFEKGFSDPSHGGVSDDQTGNHAQHEQPRGGFMI